MRIISQDIYFAVLIVPKSRKNVLRIYYPFPPCLHTLVTCATYESYDWKMLNPADFKLGVRIHIDSLLR